MQNTDASSSKTDVSPLHAAVVAGNLKIIDLLVKHDASLYKVDSNGCTPLHYAALASHAAAFVLLCRLGADQETRNADKKTAMEEFKDEKVRREVEAELSTGRNEQVNVDALKKCSLLSCNSYEMHEGQFKRCARCKKAKYCKVQCQKDHWSEHKKNCKQ